MELSKHGIVIWCGDAPNQRALAHKIAAKYNVAGIVVDGHKSLKVKKSLASLFTSVLDRVRFKKIYDAWKELMRSYDDKFPGWPDVPVIQVPSINNEQARVFTMNYKPDLVIVSGTGLVKEPLISLPVRIGIINLHTGLSPYVKGGPNCTNWCIANNEWHLIGNTIMWLNAGIDAGNLITTETLDIRNSSTLAEAHRAVMEHAHDLYIKAIGYLLQVVTFDYQSVPQQSLGKGNLYLTRMWTATKRKLLLRNWRKRYLTVRKQLPVTVPLPEWND